ncbi:PrsW family intramembrane metalloprotease [Stieleria sp. TO1_6]|uniref:PrsW family glutamic-type intramembrane protease n=1 Tax=Stieleria tagensis TaxID=2956795 RepID=UPI00209B36CE|nr:PrsW family glutamic-type intramembrane protease [Stieleria tagensis]MCO8121711.1 PrsW family intramembrane metalloprotease [Stieleria tagensis]
MDPMTVGITLGLVPTIVLLALLWWIDPTHLRSPRIWIALVTGMLITAPVWVLETVVDNWATNITGAYAKLFVVEVLGAAVVEELVIAIALLGLVFLSNKWADTPRRIVAIAVAIAIGFTTIENMLGVWSTDRPTKMGISRLMTIPCGHVSLQLVMGYFAARALLETRHRGRWAALMILVPILIHGWGDYSENLFQYEANLDPDSDATKHLFSCWILALAAYVAGAAAVLWRLRWRKHPS